MRALAVGLAFAAVPAVAHADGGEVLLDLGSTSAPIPFHAAVTLINAGGEILFLGRERTSGFGVVDHGVLRGSTIDVTIPQIPGLGPEGAVVRSESFTVTRASGLLRTPARCPRSGRWTFRREHRYGDGVTDVARVASPCRRPRAV